MSEGGFLQQKPKSPTSLVVVIVLHAVVLGALAMSKMDVPVMKVFDPLKIKDVPVDPAPPPVEKQVEPEKKPAETPRVTYTPPRVKTPVTSNQPVPAIPTVDPPVFDKVDAGEPAVVPQPKILPPPTPVRVEAQIDARSQLQPPYPASEERAEVEGSVTVRLVIGADGRVKSVEKVRSASDSFFRSTERHALKHWRFKPATLDGRPVESTKTMTVHFRLQE